MRRRRRAQRWRVKINLTSKRVEPTIRSQSYLAPTHIHVTGASGRVLTVLCSATIGVVTLCVSLPELGPSSVVNRGAHLWLCWRLCEDARRPPHPLSPTPSAVACRVAGRWLPASQGSFAHRGQFRDSRSNGARSPLTAWVPAPTSSGPLTACWAPSTSSGPWLPWRSPLTARSVPASASSGPCWLLWQLLASGTCASCVPLPHKPNTSWCHCSERSSSPSVARARRHSDRNFVCEDEERREERILTYSSSSSLLSPNTLYSTRKMLLDVTMAPPLRGCATCYMLQVGVSPLTHTA
jgi:hypothetical protein